MFIGGDKKTAGAAGGVEDFVAGLRIETGHHEINDVTRGAELAVLALGSHALQEIFKGVSEFLAVRISETVDLGEKKREDASVAELEKCVAKNIAEKCG